MSQPPPVSAEDVRRVARLARLELDELRTEECRGTLAAVIGYVERLRELDLSGVEPMSHAADAPGLPRADAPGDALPNQTLMRMAPETLEPFIKVPKVLGDGGSA